MENNNQSSSSPPPPSPPPPPPPPASSSFTTQLFGDNDSQSSSSGIFASIFPSPSTVARNSNCLHLSLDNQIWSTINGTSGVMNMDNRSIFLERVEPCPLSSSIYYGGQEDMYIRSSTDLNSRSYTKFLMKHDLKDDPNHLRIATRGNWWEGSLYY